MALLRGLPTQFERAAVVLRHCRITEAVHCPQEKLRRDVPLRRRLGQHRHRLGQHRHRLVHLLLQHRRQRFPRRLAAIHHARDPLRRPKRQVPQPGRQLRTAHRARLLRPQLGQARAAVCVAARQLYSTFAARTLTSRS